jgi:hypothetical protein
MIPELEPNIVAATVLGNKKFFAFFTQSIRPSIFIILFIFKRRDRELIIIILISYQGINFCTRAVRLQDPFG